MPKEGGEHDCHYHDLFRLTFRLAKMLRRLKGRE